MRPLKTIALLLVLVPAVSLAPKVSLAREKKPNVSAVFRNATFVYVESPEGDIYRPGLYPPDRQAIGDVEDALREWNRYKLTTRRADADIVVVVQRAARGCAARRAGVVWSAAAAESSPGTWTRKRTWNWARRRCRCGSRHTRGFQQRRRRHAARLHVEFGWKTAGAHLESHPDRRAGCTADPSLPAVEGRGREGLSAKRGEPAGEAVAGGVRAARELGEVINPRLARSGRGA